MSSSIHQVYSSGIYHGLPVLDPKHRNLKAIVVGASGMSGQCMIDVLSQNPDRWSKVYAMSRRPPQTSASNVQHVPLDLLKEPDDIAALMRENEVQADIVFFFGYVSLSPSERAYSASNKESAQKLSDINARILSSFLSALSLASIHPKRILLQTGLKNYGVHQGPVTTPCREHDPRVELDGQANFYYAQEDVLFAHCASRKDTSWTITMPSFILGAVKGSDMTTFLPLAVYASVQRKLGKPLRFPGDWAAWAKMLPMSTGKLNSWFHEWGVLQSKTAGERFNIVDSSDFSWGRAWPVMAGWFGIEWEGPVEEADGEGEGVYEDVEMPLRPRGAGPKGHCRASFSLPAWTKDRAVQSAWADLKREHNLTSDSVASGTAEGMWASLHFSLTMSWSWATSMDKARKLGWHGHVDTMEAMTEVFEQFEALKMIPPTNGARPGADQ